MKSALVFAVFVGIKFTVTVLIVLKLSDRIDWSWWLVTAPLWLEVATVVGLAFFVSLIDTEEAP